MTAPAAITEPIGLDNCAANHAANYSHTRKDL
jgi:hypothetical protein